MEIHTYPMADVMDRNLVIQITHRIWEYNYLLTYLCIQRQKKEIDTRKTDINTYLLSILASKSNTYLLLTVKFKWDCSKFQHNVGYLTIDIIFQRYLQLCLLKSTTTKKDLRLDKHVASAREYYICDKGDEGIFCSNQKWKTLLYIEFVEYKGPCVLTCS